MGLDTVELVMEFEQAFDIQIPNAEAAEMVSVKDATDIIFQHVRLQPSERCRTKSSSINSDAILKTNWR